MFGNWSEKEFVDRFVKAFDSEEKHNNVLYIGLMLCL